MVLLKLLFVANIVAIGLSSAYLLDRSNEINTRIIGGNLTTIEKNPWQVSLQHDNDHLCGGVIISEKWILTSGMCDGLEVRVGSSFHAEGGQIVPVKRFIRHDNFNQTTFDYDFALLELFKPLKFDDQIQAIALPDPGAEVPEGIMCRIAGWGLTDNLGDPRDQLHAVNIPIVSREHCQAQFNELKWNITEQMICAGYKSEEKGFCLLDNGGALVQFTTGNPTLVGVASFGLCGVHDFSDVFSNVASVRSWIKTVTGA